MTLDSFADEEWRAIAGADNGHEISSYGRVRNSKGRVRVLAKHKLGYYFLGIRINGVVKNKNAHRLVAEAFIGPSILAVDHIDGNKANNHISNLAYMTKKDNVVKHFSKKYKYIGTRKSGNKWEAATVVDGKRTVLGLFTSREEAAAVYRNFLKANKSVLFGDVA